RLQLNEQIRKALGDDTAFPIAGEKLLILKNRHGKALANGDVVTIAEFEPGGPRHGFLHMQVLSEDREAAEIAAHMDLLLNDDTSAVRVPTEPCTLGYCLTVHKAQGSEWENVFLVDENSAFREHRSCW